MRSIHTAKEGNSAKRDYYTKDKSLSQGKSSGKKTYYGKGETTSTEAAMTDAVWFGKDAERLRLVGHVHQEDFEQIYDGFIPGSDERIRFEKVREDQKQNCLYDLVLSCKKSVSMQIHLGKDDRLYQAYQETVVEVAELIQRDYAQARRQFKGERNVIQTEGIIAVLMPHHTTRDLDPGVHTHLLIANGTHCEDGKWRSLRDVGFSHAYYLGDYFAARLAARVQELGYKIRETVTEQGHPSWELAGYTDEEIKVFSKRSEDAEVKKLVAAGYSRDDALLVTRRAKDVDETIEQLQERWGKEASTHGIEAIVPSERPVRVKRQATAEDILESAIRHYSHNSVHFSRDQIREYAFKLNRPFDVMQLDQAIGKHPELIDYGRFGNLEDFQGHFTTAKALEREIRTIKGWMDGQGKATSVMERETSTQALAAVGGHPLKAGQQSAVIGVLASVNQHQCIHGLSGVGKTSALKALKTLMDSRGIEIIGLAPSIPAAQKLGEELGIETQTVQKFIRSDLELKRGQFLVIDESGMDSADMLDVVMQKANAAGARVLLVGDTGQNQAIEAGSPMRSVMAHGAEVHHIAEIIRQQNAVQRRAVELIAAGHGLDALSLLSEHDYVTEIEDRCLRVASVAAEYLKLSVKEQGKTLIVTGTNAEKDAITSEIRTGLKAAGLLGESVNVVQLRDRALTPEQSAEVLFYRVGDFVTLSRNYKTTGLQKDTPYEVRAKDGDELILSSAGGRLYRFNPKHYKDKKVFSAHEFDVAVGDSLRWTSTNREAGQINGHTFKVSAINKGIATAITAKGKQIEIDLSRPLTVDYTLCSTSYRAQGSDRPRVFVSATNDPTSNREPFYVSISRQIKTLKIWTDSFERLKDRVAESRVQRNPLELLKPQPTNQGKTNDQQNESSRPRNERDSDRDSGRPAGRDGGTESFVRNPESSDREPSYNRGIERETSGDTRRNLERGRVHREQTERGREQDLRRDWLSRDINRRLDGTSTGELSGTESAHSSIDGEQPEARLTVAEQLVELAYADRLGRELSGPLAKLVSALVELRKVEAQNAALQAEIAARTELVMNQAKVEILDTTLSTWRSLRENPESVETASTEMREMIATYPAQKVVDYALREFSRAATPSLKPKTTPKPVTGPTARPTPKTSKRNSKPTSKPHKPKPIEVFWEPDYSAVQKTEQIESRHWGEFQSSSIHPELVTANIESLSGQPVYERLLSERLAQLGTGQYVTQPMARLMAQYEQVAEGGWWGTAGIDAKSLLTLDPGQQPQLSTWGVFKADYPRVDQDKSERKGQTEYIKYENPLGVNRSLYLPNVPEEIAQRIYAKHNIQPTELERQSGFWSVVANHPEIPIVVTEGFKKSLASLSQGEVTIGLAGVNALYRARDDDKTKLPERVLNEEMAIFATPGRSITFAYDSDSKTSTVFNVRAELVRAVELLEARDTAVKVAKWKPELGKGLDDLITNQGPSAYVIALAKAEAAEREKQIYYRTQYNALAREVRKAKPGIAGEALDIEVYLLAITKGELKDGKRFLSQSDHARSLKDPKAVAAYIEHIKASIPQYLQQQQALEQERKDRTIYEELVQSITAEMGALKPGPLDIEVCIRLTNYPDLERILAQSDWVKSRETPEEKARYIQSVQSAAALTLQQRAEAQTRAENEALAVQAQQQRELEAAKRAAQLQAQQQKELAVTQAAAQAAAQRQAQQPAESRAQYEAIAQQVRNQLYGIQPNQFDSVVYKWAQAKGLDGDLVLAQSDQAQSLKHPAQVNGYLRQVKRLANRLDLEPGPDMSAQQRQLNVRAVMSCDWLADNYGKDQSDGWRVFEGIQFSCYAKNDEYKIYSHAKRRVVLERGNNRLVGTLSLKEIEKLENAVAKGKVMKAEERKAQVKVQEIKKARKPRK